MARPGKDAISQLADQQHGLVTRAQVLRLGLTEDCVDGRVRRGRYQPVQRGVYRIGSTSSDHEAVMAAVLSCPGAVASHGSAGFLWGIVARPPAVDLIVGRDHGRRPGIRAHRSTIAPDQITKIEGIPVSTISRTLLDLASALSGRELEQAVAGAERAHVSRGELLELMTRSRNRVGMPRLRALLEHTGQLPSTRSEAEDRFLALIRKGELPPPEVNATLAGYEVDFAWRDERIVVEVDGFAFHSSRSRFESDRRRDAKLATEGFLVMRVTWRQLAHEPEATLVRLAQALTVARAGGSRGT